MLFCGQAVAQTNSPRYAIRCSYDSNKEQTERIRLRFLSQDFFPWGVCFKKPYFREINGASETSIREDQWTRRAMQGWNIAYRNYKINRWGSDDVIGIPDGPLFVGSCDRDNYNIIYTVKADLGSNDRDTLGRYISVDEYWDWRIFYSIIKMDTHHYKGGKPRHWDREHFINVYDA